MSAVCCSVLQCNAVLQCDTVCCSVMQYATEYCSVLRVCRSALQHVVAACYSVPRCVAVCCPGHVHVATEPILRHVYAIIDY